MIYLFSGEDTYESYTKAREALAKLCQKTNSTTDIVNADEIIDVNIFLQKLEGVGMFSDASIIFAKRLFNNKKLLEYFVENFDRLNKYNIVIWQDSKVDSKLKLAKLLANNKAIYNYDLSREGELKNWLMSEAKRENVQLSSSQVQFIIERITDKWALINEIMKLKIYLKAKDKKGLADNELNDILGFNIKGDMWKFLDFVGIRNKKSAMNEFKKLTAFESNTQLLLAMLDRELRLISQVIYARKNGTDLKDLKLAPFVLQKTQSKASKFNFKEVQSYLSKLFSLDMAIKSGEIDENLGMIMFLSSI